MKLTRIESREVFEVPKRLHYIWSLKNGTITFYLEGRELKDDEIGGVLANYIQALNTAETQIEKLKKVISDYFLDRDDLEEYLEDYPEDENFKQKYKIEDLKDALFHSMMKKDEKAISKFLNQINVIEEKSKP